jgi:two-component system sensor histidine kinase CpxA
LVNQLLTFSKASFGGPIVHIQPVHVADAAAEAILIEKTEAAVIETSVPDDIVVSADPELLIRALANLIRNAIRYGAEAGPIRIFAARDKEDAVTITISDSGPGVPEEELPKIFDAFYRVDPSRNRQTGGSGLGLAIVRTCIDSCNGAITAENRRPHGLAVHIHLPAAPPPGQTAQEDGKQATAPALAPAQSPPRRDEAGRPQSLP